MPLRQKAYQPCGDLWLDFPGHEAATDYTRTLDLDTAIATVRYKVGGVTYTAPVGGASAATVATYFSTHAPVGFTVSSAEGGNVVFTSTMAQGDVADLKIEGTAPNTSLPSSTINLATGTASSNQTGADTLSNIENVTGSAGRDLITGSSLSNEIIGGTGSDTILAGDGNDWVLFDATDAIVDGGGGNNDILAIQTANTTVNFNTLNTQLSGIEEIDLTGHGVQNLVLTSANVFDLSDTTNVLKIHGGVGDTVALAGNWIAATPQPVIYNGESAVQYSRYTLYDAATDSTATVLLAPGVALSISYVGSTGPDQRTYNPTDAMVDGNTGDDTLSFAPSATNQVLDMVDSSNRPDIRNMENIDISGGGTNFMAFNAASVAAMSTTSDVVTIDAAEEHLIVTSPGTGSTTETTTVTFADMAAGQTMVLGGITYTAPVGGASAATVAAAFAGIASGAASTAANTSGTLASFSSVLDNLASPFSMIAASMLTSDISLTITATFNPSRLFKILLKRVVFPAPRNPDNTVTGNFIIIIHLSVTK
mgnify:CR=1 FL=1